MEFSLSYLGIVILVHYFLAFEGTTNALGGNESDGLALLEFKAKITSDPLGVLRSWNGSTHFCQWHGITCSSQHQRVIIMDLAHSQLSGSISPHIGNLSFLLKVNLENNSFTHQIPAEIGRLPELQILWLNNNSIQGTIPANISACTQLGSLGLGKNNLVGQIPMELGSLLSLLYLQLSYNNLAGNIPDSFGNFSSLKILQATSNNLVGRIPNTLGQLKNLVYFDLGANSLSGIIPPAIFNISSIIDFDMTLNQFHGSLPSNLGNTLPNLQSFSIVDSQFKGSIPVSISNASQLTRFQVGGNSLTGRVPSLEKLQMLEYWGVTRNHLGSGGADHEDLSFLCSMTNATSLQSLHISENNFGGAVPECIGNLSTTLEELELSNNKIFGSIPDGIGNLVNLERLEMWRNQLSGDIPSDIGKLQKMQFMALNENNLSGKIPPSIGNLRELSKLYLYRNNLQGSIPSSLGQCHNLILLSLSYNNLSGPIPAQVIGISSLSIAVSLGQNQLSGTLPLQIENLKNLALLDVSDNLLSGEIPSRIGSCVELVSLILSGNSFQGSIPLSFSSLRGIQNLDLSRNNFSGEIPTYLEDFGSLQILNLSYNNFEGMVPMQGVFKNASATLVQGNSELCGGIPEFMLPKCNSKASKNKRLSLALTIVIASLSGLVVVILVLSFLFLCYFRKRRRTPTSTTSNESFLKVSYKALLEATNGFSPANMIGMGSFGSVYKGTLDQSQTLVAVKVFNLLCPGASKSFIAECEALRNVRHRNLLRVLTTCSGVDYGGNDFKALVFEFMVNGSLEEWLHQAPPTTETANAPRKMNLVQRLNVMIDVASALDYLHLRHQQSPIVHCDLKPSNILLDGDMIGHVGDFGLARFLQDATGNEASFIAIKGSIGYTAPEYGMGSEFSTNGDVYSFGILVLEVFTGKRPTDDTFQGNMNLHNLVVEALPERASEILDPILLQDVEEVITRRTSVLNCLVSIFGIGVACSADMPTQRLGFEQVLTQLITVRGQLLYSINKY